MKALLTTPAERAASAPLPGAALVELRAATVQLGGRTVLDRIDVAVTRGERIALVGANGAGKTTLLRALHGLVPLAQGARATAGDIASGVAVGSDVLRIAMVFQRPFMLRLSLLSNIELGLRLQGLPSVERRETAMLALERVGLAAQAQRPGRALSGGQQQRAALARAWALKPQLLLLDEPTASLDPSAKREVEDLISGFSDQGITVVMSSHNLGQVKRLSRRVLYLEAGRVLADVDTDHFFHGELPTEAALFLKGELPWV
jgi:tungstate transport system ATP-binding protein